MDVQQQIAEHLAKQSAAKRGDLEALHRMVRRVSPRCAVSFFDGKDASGKTVTNPTIGYGLQTMRYADGSTKDVFRVGVAANASGISVYILGIDDKTYLTKTFGKTLGRASVTGYCIRFKALKDLDLGVLEEVMRFGVGTREEKPKKTAKKAAAKKKVAKSRATRRKG